MPEIDVLPELKKEYSAWVDSDHEHVFDFSITELFLGQDAKSCFLKIARGEDKKVIQPLKFVLLEDEEEVGVYDKENVDYWMEPKEWRTIKREVHALWQFNPNDSLGMNKNRFIYGHNYSDLLSWGLWKTIKEDEFTFTEPNPFLESKIYSLLQSIKHGDEHVLFDICYGSISANVNKTIGDSPLIHVFNIFPTEAGIRIDEV